MLMRSFGGYWRPRRAIRFSLAFSGPGNACNGLPAFISAIVSSRTSPLLLESGFGFGIASSFSAVCLSETDNTNTFFALGEAQDVKPSPNCPAPHAVFCAFSPSFSIVCSRMTNFWILPVMVIGKASTNSM